MKISLPGNYKKKYGFTLIELLVVIGILTVLLAIVLIAINPQKQFRQANNTQRRSDVNAILNAVHQYAADNKGQLPTAISTTELTIESTTGGGADICSDVAPDYIAELPVDPVDGTSGTGTGGCTTYNTYYTIQKNSANRITVKATGEDDGTGAGGGAPTIQVTR